MQRTWLLTRARLTGEWLGERGARLPVAPLLLLGGLTAMVLGLLRGALGPYPYALASLTLTLGLTTVPLLGELAPLLRADPAQEWVAALPVRPRELRAARVLALVLAAGALALACLVPAALIAPGAMDWGARGLLVVVGLGQTACVCALLLGVQALLGERADGLLVLVQAALSLLLLVGILIGLGHVPELAELEHPATALLAWPPALFALPLAADPSPAALGLAVGGMLLAPLVLLAIPFPPPPRARTTRTPLGWALGPLRTLADRLWVRPDERAAFHFVYDALPAERDFVVRTYPLMAAPLALLWIGAEPGTLHGDGLFALMLFAPAMYLPVLLLYVPSTGLPAARWVLDVSPQDPAAEDRGAQKAIALRLVLPLTLVLAGIVAALAGWPLVARLLPVSLVTSGLALRAGWSAFVTERPLSRPAADLGSAFDGTGGGMMGGAVVSALIALGAWYALPNAWIGWLLLAGFAVAELGIARRAARPA